MGFLNQQEQRALAMLSPQDGSGLPVNPMRSSLASVLQQGWQYLMRAMYDARHGHRLGLRLPFMEYLYTQPARLRAARCFGRR